MKCQRCRKVATAHVTVANPPDAFEEVHLCEDHSAGDPDDLEHALRVPWDRPAPPLAPSLRAAGFVAVGVRSVWISEIDERQAVRLREVAGTRAAVIELGIFEATSIERRLKGQTTPRPLTHDVAMIAIESLDGAVQDVLVPARRAGVYSCLLRLRQESRLVEVPVRPSDGLALALLARAPILIAEALLE